MRGAARVLLAAVVWQLLALTAWAVSGVEPVRLRVPLPQLVPVSVHRLQGAYNGFDVSLPVPERWDVREAVLTFSYVNSTALLRENSRLIVELNDHPLAQVALDPRSPEGKVTVRLPARLLTPGYNKLSFKVSQHYVLDCEDPTAPELWTTLKLDEAVLDWTVSLKPVPLRLSALPTMVFDPANPRPEKVHIAVASPSAKDAERAVMAASAAALRFSYRPVEFSVSDRLEAGRDNVLVGTPDFLSRLLGDAAPKPEGGYLEVRHMPGLDGREDDARGGVDPTHALVLVSGPDEAAVEKALQALAFLSFPFPDTPSTMVQEVRLPQVGPYEARGMLRLDRTYTFQDLGFPSVTFRGYRPAPSVLRFRLPSDILIKPHKYATLSLHVAYSAGMREDSVLALFLNGKFFSSIPLSEKAGASYEGYRISFPTYLLRPGDNELAFHAVLTPLVTGRCTQVQTQHLLLTVFDDSTLHVPGISHWAELPDLALFFRDGFPFARHPDGREAALVLPQADFAALEAAVNLVGLLSQKTGHPPVGLQVRDVLPKDPSVNVIAVGALDALPGDLLRSAPYHLAQPVRASYPVAPPHPGPHLQAPGIPGGPVCAGGPDRRPFPGPGGPHGIPASRNDGPDASRAHGPRRQDRGPGGPVSLGLRNPGSVPRGSGPFRLGGSPDPGAEPAGERTLPGGQPDSVDAPGLLRLHLSVGLRPVGAGGPGPGELPRLPSAQAVSSEAVG
ncbi:MAG: bcsB [Desulfacinum sp.]|nr:bcsB [Desulfacinum sp.]